MGDDRFKYAYDPVTTLRNCPQLMGVELRPCGPNKLCGGYYIDGSTHPWRSDKLKVYIWKGGVFVSEEGGQTMSLPNWLVQYGGAADFRDALEIIRGRSQVISWNREARIFKAPEVKYVGKDVLAAAKAYDLAGCTLFRWFCTLFPEARVREAFDRYNVTVDGQGLTVFWTIDRNGRILHDKRVRYMPNGHRDKTFGGTRKYRTGDGYTGRAFFGSHLIEDDGSDILVVEAEKTAIALYLATGKVAIATAGKNNLREYDRRFVLLPDMDAIEEWSETGNTVLEWWNLWGEGVPLGPTDDMCDLMEKNPDCIYNIKI